MFYNFLTHLFLHFNIMDYLHRILYTSLYIYYLFNYYFNYHTPHSYPIFHFHIVLFYTISHLLSSYHNPLPLPLFHSHMTLYILIHPLDMLNMFLIHLSFHFNMDLNYLNLSHIYLTNLLDSFYNLLPCLSFHFNIMDYSRHILYTLLYISHLFNYLLNYHILHFHLPFHFHTILFYIVSHPLNNYHNLLLAVLFHLHMSLYILIHLVNNLNMFLPLGFLHLHSMLYILIHLVNSSYNSLIHLSFSFSIIHIFMHPLDNFYMFLEPPIFHFHNILMHLVDSLNMFLMPPIFHFHNLKTPNSSDYNTEDNHSLNFMEVMDMNLYYQEFHPDRYPHPTSTHLLHHPPFQ